MTTLDGQNSESASPYKLNAPYFIRTVTHHYTGLLVQVTDKELVLKEAAWIADNGRFANALASGVFSEVEPFPQDLEVIIGRGAVLDASVWRHPLPKEQK